MISHTRRGIRKCDCGSWLRWPRRRAGGLALLLDVVGLCTGRSCRWWIGWTWELEAVAAELATAGMVALPIEALGPSQLARFLPDSRDEEVSRAQGDRWAGRRGGTAAGGCLEQRYPTAYVEEFDAFARAVRGGTPPRCTGQDALAAFDLAVAADRSWRSGRPLTAKPTPVQVSGDREHVVVDGGLGFHWVRPVRSRELGQYFGAQQE
jgi:hypothetical protein